MKKLLLTLIVVLACFGSAFAQGFVGVNPYNYESHWSFNDHEYLLQEPFVAAISINGQIVSLENNADNWSSLEVAAFVTNAEGQEECRGNLMFLTDEYVITYDDPYLTIDGFPIFYNTPGGTVHFKMYDHLNHIEYTECAITTIDGEPYTVTAGTGVVEGWDDPTQPVILNFTAPPTNLSVSDITAHSVTLNWTENGTATEWQICLNGDETNLITASSNPFTLTGLTPQTYYTAKVRANYGNSHSGWSNTVTFTTICPVTTIDTVVCTAELPIIWNGLEIFEEGEYTVTLNSANGCDSTVILNLSTKHNILPYFEDFESYTESTTTSMGIEPSCWELVQEDVPMPDNKKPQLYYKSDFAHSGEYSLMLNYRGVYAMPALSDAISLHRVKLEMYLRQPRSYYALEVGVWEDDNIFVPVATFNNNNTGVEFVECDFSGYTGSGHRIAFRNLNSNGDAYSYNYIDDITLTETEGCELTIEMHDSYGDSWTGNKILIHNYGTTQEVTLTNSSEGSVTVPVFEGPLSFEWVNGYYPEDCSFTITGPSCLYYEGNSMSPGVFHSMEMSCENGIPPVPDFTYWTENTCNSVIVHFENNSANAISAVWNFGDDGTSEEYSPIHEYTEDDTYQVTLSVFNNICENAYSITQNVEMTMPEPLTLPYTDNFDLYTMSTTAVTGVEPACWELVQEDVPMSDANRPQLYYKSSYAHSGNYSLRLNYRGIYAMPPLSEDIPMDQVHLEMYLRQPGNYYAVEVGIWEDDGTFVPVATFNNGTTGMVFVECDFSEYTGDGHRIAFHNIPNGDDVYSYSYNYIDDITLKYAIPAGDTKPCPGHETVTDYDGNVYNTVKIGEQCWMKENLRVTHYEDGKEIPFSDANTMSYDYNYRYTPNGDINNVSVYGYLYNWAAVMHGNAGNNDNPGIVQGVCPRGWHMPSDAEWTQLTDYVSGVSAYLCDGNPDYITKALASQFYWFDNSVACSAGNDQQGNNASGFSAVPAGYYIGEWLAYGCFGADASFWSCSQFNDYSGISRRIWSNGTAAMYDDINLTKSFGLAVRCVLGEGYNLAAVTTNWVNTISSSSAICGGNVTYDGNTAVTEVGLYLSTDPEDPDPPYWTVDNRIGEFTIDFNDLMPNTTYYVWAFARNSMGTAYGDMMSFTTCGGTLALPYSEDFENYTATTAASTGIEPACWELVQEDVAMPDSKRPQLYYKSSFAHSGNYSLKMDYRGVYAMPPIEENLAMKHVHLGMYLRQPNAAYRLQVGVWDDETGTFTPVTTFNNSTTEVEFVECDFSDYTGNGRRVAFRNVLASGANYSYSYNYIDDITLTETEGCELTIEMHSQDWSWDGSYIRVHTDGSVKEVTLNGGYEETVNVTVHNGTLDLEWVNGWWPEACSFTVSGLPCLYYSTETAPTEGVFYNTEINCDGDNTTAIPDFSYWTENACNSVIVHFENNSTDADYFVWDFGDWNTSEEWAPAHEYTEGTYLVTLSANNGSCEDFSVIKKYIDVYMPEPITTHLDTTVCAAELPLTWYGQEITHGGIYSTTLQTVTGCDSIVYMNFNVVASTFAHTPDTIVSANEPVTLWAAGSSDFIWTDANGNVIGEGNNITVIPTENTTYYVTKPGDNLIQGNFVNGNFEQGNTGFSTQYNYYSYGACGCYYIDYDSYSWNWGYGNTADHTTGSGLFMMVDASSYRTIWSQTINVTPHTNYTFSAWFLTLSYANISYYVNGENITNFDFIETGNIWEPHSGTWYSGDNTTATISINTEWADCGGYDFGLDDIMFYSGSCSSTESITLTLLPTGDAQPCPGIPTMTDYDGNVYNTVKIGNQCWMKENLKTTHYADGNEIALGEETSLSIPYRYKPGEVDVWHEYGYLYNWAAVMNGINSSAANPSGVQGVCPDGWHVPSNAEWAQLTNYLSSEPVYQCGSSSEIAKALIFPEEWSWWWDNECNPGYSNENTTGFNTTGFSIRPAGSYDGDYTITINGNYYDFSSHAAFWSSTKSSTRNAWGIQLFCNSSNVYRYYFNKGNGFSVRCVYNEAIASIPAVETGEVMFITPTYATCGGNVTDDGGATVTERGICWSTEHSPTLEDNSIIDGTGTGEWQTLLSDLTESTIYYVRAYATNSMGTGYGEVITFTTTTCESITLPYTETFEDYTAITTASTGIEPACWELVQDDVAMTASTRPQLYYKSSFAHSGSYSLKMGNRCVYAMPALSQSIPLNQVTLDMYLRQANAAYRLEVGVWDDQTQTFEAVQLFNNSTTNVEHVTCDFSNYNGNGRRIAFRNVLANGANYAYSYNYLDDINLTLTANKSTEVTNANTTDAGMLGADRDMVDFIVYPNPTKDFVNVQCTTNDVHCSGIEVIDVYGKVVRTVVGANNDSPTQINVSGLAAGMYFVRVTTEKGAVTKPFVKR